MSHNVDILDGAIRHQQAMLKIKISSILRRPIHGLSDESFVFRMNPFENKFHGRLGDRKSTRLNSSHQIISYAVFCLKKKHAELSRLSSRIERQQSCSSVKWLQ